MNLVSGTEYEGYDCVTFEMDNVKLRTIMTTQGTRRTRGVRGGLRGPEVVGEETTSFPEF